MNPQSSSKSPWPYIAFVGGLAVLIALGAVASFGWARDDGTDQSTIGKKATDDLAKEGDDLVLPSAILRDPCEAMPPSMESQPVPNTPDHPVRTCDWFGPADDSEGSLGDPYASHLHRIRVSVPVQKNTESIFARYRERTEGSSARYEPIEVDRGENDKAIAWASKDSKNQGQRLVGIAVVRDGGMGVVEVTGTRLGEGPGGRHAPDDKEELLETAQKVIDEIEPPDREQLASRAQWVKKHRTKPAFDRPEQRNACAVPEARLRDALGKNVEKSEDSDRKHCAWSGDLEGGNWGPGDEGEGTVSVDMQRFPDPVEASLAVSQQALSDLDGVAIFDNQAWDVEDESYDPPGDEIVVAGASVPKRGTDPDGNKAEMTLQVHDTVVHIEYDVSDTFQTGEPGPIPSEVAKKEILGIAKGVVGSMT